jgi:hypothetical protein
VAVAVILVNCNRTTPDHTLQPTALALRASAAAEGKR